MRLVACPQDCTPMQEGGGRQLWRKKRLLMTMTGGVSELVKNQGY